MPLIALGINHRTAPVELREQVAFGGEHIADALRDLALDARQVALRQGVQGCQFLQHVHGQAAAAGTELQQTGRASCRERV